MKAETKVVNEKTFDKKIREYLYQTFIFDPIELVRLRITKITSKVY